MWKYRLYYLVGAACLVQACLLLIPLFVASALGEDEALAAFLTTIVCAALIGGGLFAGYRGIATTRTVRLTLLFPFMSFFAMALISSLPFYILHPLDGLLTAVFESVSFMSTNGGSAYVASESQALNAWRIVLAWEGGYLFIVYMLVILRTIKSGAAQLHISPLDHGDSIRNYNRLIDTARLVAPYYFGMSALFFVVFSVLGHSFSEAVTLMVASVSLTGFPYMDTLLVSPNTQAAFAVCALLAALNPDMIFSHSHSGKLAIWYDPESRHFIGFMIVVGVVALLGMAVRGVNFDLLDTAFAVVSLATTVGTVPPGENPSIYFTGFGFLAMLLVCFGGALASPSGGLKQLRLMSLIQLCQSELKRLAHPHSTTALNLGSEKLGMKEGNTVWFLLSCFVLALTAGILALGINGMEIESAISLALSAITLSGPAVEVINPSTLSYAALRPFEYGVLTVLMLVGRLEATIIFSLLAKRVWRG